MALDPTYTVDGEVLDIAFADYAERYEESEVTLIDNVLSRVGASDNNPVDSVYVFDIRRTDTMLMLLTLHDEILSRIEALNQMIAIDDDPEQYQKDERRMLQGEVARLGKFIDQYDKERAK